MQNFIKIFKKFQEIGSVSQSEPLQRLGQSQMTFDNLLGYILSISMCMQNFITIVHSVRPFSLFQNLELGTASTNVKCHFAISWAKFGNPSLDHTNSNVYVTCYQNIPNGSRGRASFIFFQNLNLGKTSTNPKGHLTI